MVETLHEPAKVFRELGKQLDLAPVPKSNKRTENCRVPTLTIGPPAQDDHAKGVPVLLNSLQFRRYCHATRARFPS